MEDVRCKCGKLLCQYEASVVVIKCRHCKRNIYISFNESSLIGGKNPAQQPTLVGNQRKTYRQDF